MHCRLFFMKLLLICFSCLEIYVAESRHHHHSTTLILVAITS